MEKNMPAAMPYCDAPDSAHTDRGAPSAQAHEGANVSVRDLSRLLQIDCPDDAWLARMAATLQERSKTLLELTESAHWYLSDQLVFDEKAVAKFLVPDNAGVLRDLAAGLGGDERVLAFHGDRLAFPDGERPLRLRRGPARWRGDGPPGRLRERRAREQTKEEGEAHHATDNVACRLGLQPSSNNVR